MYTRHTSTYHHDYHPSSVWLDKLCNRLATRVISISQATDFTLLTLEKIPAKKVVKIPHGIKSNYFTDVPLARIDHLRNKWNIPRSSPVVGVIARHIEWKGVQYIVPAFGKFIAEFPDAILVLANAEGPYHQNILEQLKSVDSRRVVLIPFEQDIAALYHIFDLYVHVPVDLYCEAFGQTYVEALASGVPSIVTRSGVGAEFLKHDENAWIVDYRNSDQIAAGLKEVWQKKDLGEKLSRTGMNSVSPYSFEAMLHSLIALYNE